ncbi:GntR family transcriptional regulator [Sedimentibacter sp. zth1]|uniref:GntR family transcriptional regulator n=1 Tax=Sedimentibacter sp. zth1 TaxID=2816908 RepID=UPI001A92AA80|nr:GntR family transcriptional regulator [Sedimentibacter sp. zth1]QSX06161.1 GntR family transcriptional regulator [Sedimentibacter sp. zth1]
MKIQNTYKTIREEVAIVLRNKILRGDIQQGDHIIESDIADELGISRGPVREALRQLEQEGLISYSARRGCTVKTISAKDAEELYIIRAALEVLAVEKCSCKYSEETLKKMEHLVSKMGEYAKTNDLIHIVECDQLFHECIVLEAKMSKLHEMWCSLNSSNAIIFYALYHTKYSPNEKLPDNHSIIIDSLRSGDTYKASRDIEDNYMVVSKNLYKNEKGLE